MRLNATHRPVLCLLPSAFCLLAVLTTGCVRRSLTIRTEPPGALVYINDQLKGTSPVTYDFMWYGWHRLILRKEGFERLDDRRELRSPIYLWIPFDLVMEMLPFPIRDARTWSYTLTPASAPPTPVPPELLYPKPKSTEPSAAAVEPPAPTEAQPSAESASPTPSDADPK
jgi:hypothetical protein